MKVAQADCNKGPNDTNCSDDGNEPNDEPNTAIELSNDAETEISDLSICGANDDWFVVEKSAGQTLIPESTSSVGKVISISLYMMTRLSNLTSMVVVNISSSSRRFSRRSLFYPRGPLQAVVKMPIR